jgi:hypothetical protein
MFVWNYVLLAIGFVGGGLMAPGARLALQAGLTLALRLGLLHRCLFLKILF